MTCLTPQYGNYLPQELQVLFGPPRILSREGYNVNRDGSVHPILVQSNGVRLNTDNPGTPDISRF